MSRSVNFPLSGCMHRQLATPAHHTCHWIEVHKVVVSTARLGEWVGSRRRAEEEQIGEAVRKRTAVVVHSKQGGFIHSKQIGEAVGTVRKGTLLLVHSEQNTSLHSPQGRFVPSNQDKVFLTNQGGIVLSRLKRVSFSKQGRFIHSKQDRSTGAHLALSSASSISLGPTNEDATLWYHCHCGCWPSSERYSEGEPKRRRRFIPLAAEDDYPSLGNPDNNAARDSDAARTSAADVASRFSRTGNNARGALEEDRAQKTSDRGGSGKREVDEGVVVSGSSSGGYRAETKADPAALSKPVQGALSLLRFYKREISPWLPGSCRYVPSCSEYSMIAFQRYGFWKGGILTAWRLLRCNPLGGTGFDPPRWFGEPKPPSY